jgi:hypothetical protein
MLYLGLGLVYLCGTPAVYILLHLAIISDNLYMRLFFNLWFVQ